VLFKVLAGATVLLLASSWGWTQESVPGASAPSVDKSFSAFHQTLTATASQLLARTQHQPAIEYSPAASPLTFGLSEPDQKRQVVRGIELRQAVDAMRAVAGFGDAPWTDPTLAPCDRIKAFHLLDLRTWLDDAATRLGYSTSAYTDAGLTSGFVIKRIHIEELRQRIRTIAG